MKTKIKKIIALLCAVVIVIPVITFTVEATELVDGDIRYDFLMGDEGFKASQNKLNPTRTIKNGWYIMSVNDAPTSGPVEQMGYEIGDINLGDGGYYMHVKEDINIISPAWCSATITNVSGTNVNGTTDSVTGVKTFDLSQYTGIQKIKRLYNLSESGAAAHMGSISVDWIVFSKNPTLTEETAMITSINDVVLSQNGDETEMEVAASVYNAAVEGSIDGLPEGFSAVAESDVIDITYSTKVSDYVIHKVLDITATGKKNEVVVSRQYRLVLKEFTPDIRYDFVENAEGVLSKDYILSAEHKVVDGQYIMSVNQSPDNSKTEQIGFKINPVDFGDGGYYMHVKESWNFTSPVKVSGIATLSAEVRDDKWGTSIANESPNKSTDNSIRTYDIRNVKGCKEIRRIYNISEGAASNVDGSISIDWIVFSKSANYLNNGPINGIEVGENYVEIVSNENVVELEIAGSIYDNLEIGTVRGTPEGITLYFSSEAITYTMISDYGNYKFMDVTAVEEENGVKMPISYRFKLVKIPEPIALSEDIRYDFIEGDEGAIAKDYILSVERKVENGQYVMSANQAPDSSVVEQIGFYFNPVNLGDGGYYMHVKESWDFNSPVNVSAIHMIVAETQDDKWGTTVQMDQPRKTSDSAIRTYDITGYTGEKEIRRIYNISEGAATNIEGSISVDWIVFSKTQDINNSSVLEKIEMFGNQFNLPQNGDCLEVNLNTKQYNMLKETNDFTLPQDWGMYPEKGIDYNISITEKADYKVIDVVASNFQACRTYRIIATLKEKEMKTTEDSSVVIDGAMNVDELSRGEYVCDLYPEKYDLLQVSDIVVDALDETAEVKIDKKTDSIVVTVEKENATIFQLQCSKVKSSNRIIVNTPLLKNKAISFAGNVKNENDECISAGTVKIVVFEKDGIGIKAMSTVDIQNDGSFEGSISVPDSDNLNPELYDINVGFYSHNTEMIKPIKYYNEKKLEELIDTIKGNDGKNIFTNIQNSTEVEIFQTMGIWTDFSSDVLLIDSMLEKQAAVVNVDSIAEIVNGSIIGASIKKHNEDDIIALIENYDENIASIEISGLSFSDLTEEGQKLVIKNLYADSSINNLNTWEEFKNLIECNILFYAIYGTDDYKKLDTIILDNAKILIFPSDNIENTILGKIKDLSANYSDDVMRILVNSQGSKMFANKTALLNAINKALEDKRLEEDRQHSGSSGGSSGGSGSGGSSGVKFVINDNIDNKVNIPTQQELKYDDLTGYDWAKNAIYELSNQGIVNGVGNGKFEPGRTILREEFVKLLCVAFDFSMSNTQTSFNDVNKDAWYYQYISSAVSNGIASGFSEEEFGIGKNITREDMAVMMHNVLKIKGMSYNNLPISFTDMEMISDYAKEAVSLMGGAEILNGTGNGEFSPKKFTTRAEAIVAIYRCLQAF